MSSPLKLEGLSRDQIEKLVVLHSSHVKALQTANNIFNSTLDKMTGDDAVLLAKQEAWNVNCNAINAEVEALRASILSARTDGDALN